MERPYRLFQRVRFFRPRWLLRHRPFSVGSYPLLPFRIRFASASRHLLPLRSRCDVSIGVGVYICFFISSASCRGPASFRFFVHVRSRRP